MFNSAVGVQDAVHVPYRAAAPALQNMIAGRLDHYCLLAAAAVSFINDHSLQALAVLTAERSPLFPNLPTTQEQCIPVVDGYYWNAFFMRTALDRQAVQDRLRTAASTAVAPDRHSRHYLRTFLRSEITRWAAIMSSAGVAQQ
ncbi:Bug family tripartite tricarboxylate transporter substrate binding protein [Falsiroseomonas frigidaquae]|uniref:Bug family tripartite tricarboxylate transporter substrate binding protein n=1 Tax=Falsiroseomonas frigidaquae TaxID=487318 RepID=UPI001FD73A36|nr:tripartite tricarboxylate transporter substrate-binding protein [Falsiroseomonas frigidaquae]